MQFPFVLVHSLTFIMIIGSLKSSAFTLSRLFATDTSIPLITFHSYRGTIRTGRSPVSRFVSSSSSGEAFTKDYRIKFVQDGKEISPWHDIPLRSGTYYNFITEIPKYSKAKMEVTTKEKHNPIAQDIKKGKLRDYHGPIFWNYGCFPQTWENPSVLHPELKYKGDNDPLDVVEIGSKIAKTGSVTPVKVLGVLAMIDDGELDWKVIAIDASDPLADKLNDVADVEVHCPGVVSGIREWFRWYKTPDGKALNSFGFGEAALSRKVAEEVVQETHHFWKDLVSGKLSSGTLWTPSADK